MSGIYQLSTYLHNGAGNFAQNVWHWQLSEAGSGVTPFEYADALCSKFITSLATPYLLEMGGDVVLDYIAARKIHPGGGIASVRLVGQNGGAANNSCSGGINADIAWLSNAPTNRAGHTYMPFFPFDALQGDVWSNTFGTHINTFIGLMVIPLTLAGALGDATFGMYTRKTQTFNIVTAGLLKPKATAMGRRLLPQI